MNADRPDGTTITIDGRPATLDDLEASVAAMPEARRAALGRALDQIATAIPALSELAELTGGPVEFSIQPARVRAPAPSGPAERTWYPPKDQAAEIALLRHHMQVLRSALRGVALPAPAQAALDALIGAELLEPLAAGGAA